MRRDARGCQRSLEHQKPVSAPLREHVRRAELEVVSVRPPPHRLRDRGVDVARGLECAVAQRPLRQLQGRASGPRFQEDPVGQRLHQLLLPRAGPELDPRQRLALRRLVRLRQLGLHVADGIAEPVALALAGHGGGRKLEVVRVQLERARCAHLVGRLAHRRLVVLEEEGSQRVPGQVRPARREPAKVVDLHRVPRLQAREADALLLRDGLGLEDAPVGLDGAQAHDLGVGRDAGLAEFGDALLVEDPCHGVRALDAAAVREHLGRAVIEDPHRARARRRRLGRLQHRGSVAIAPRHDPIALVERDLLPDLQVARDEQQRRAPRLHRRLGLAEQLERPRQPAQGLGAPGSHRHGGPQRGHRGRQLLARRPHVRQLLQPARLCRAHRGGSRQQLLGASEVAAAPRGLGSVGEPVAAGDALLPVLPLIADHAAARRQVEQELQGVAAPGDELERLLGVGPGPGGVPAGVEQPRARHQHPCRERRLVLLERGLRLVEILDRVVEPLRLALQRRRGQADADHQRVLARRLPQIGQRPAPRDAVGDDGVVQELLGAQGERGRSARRQRHRAVDRGARHGPVVAHRRARQEPGRQGVVGGILQHGGSRVAQVRAIPPGGRRGADLAQIAGSRGPRAGELGGSRAAQIGDVAVRPHQGDPEPVALRAAPAGQHAVRSRGEPDRRGLRAGTLQRVRDAGDHHRAVEARLQGRRAFDPDQVVPAPFQGHVAHGVVHVAVARLQVEPDVAIGKVQCPVVGRGGGRGRSVERQRPAQIEEAERRERSPDPPPLHGAHRAPGLPFDPRVASRASPTPGDARARLAQQARGARRGRSLQRLRRGGDQVVDLRRLPLQIEQAHRGELRDRIGGGCLDGGDEAARRAGRVRPVLRDLAQPGERQRPLRGGPGLRRRAEPVRRSARIRGDQVAQPSGPGLQRAVLVRRRFRGGEGLHRVFGLPLGARRTLRPGGAGRQHESRDDPRLPHRAAVCSGAASTRWCSASSSRPRNARNAA